MYAGLENACQTQLVAAAAGQPIPMNEDVALHTQQQVGNELTMWASFQVYWDWITHEEPDLLD